MLLSLCIRYNAKDFPYIIYLMFIILLNIIVSPISRMRKLRLKKHKLPVPFRWLVPGMIETGNHLSAPSYLFLSQYICPTNQGQVA